MAISSLTKYFLLLLLPLLAASVPIDSNTMDLGNGIYFHNEAGEVTNFVALEDLQSRAADTTPRSVDVSPLEERALAYTAKCFSATFDTNDKSVGLGDLSDILGRYPTLASKSSISFTYYSVIVYVCNYSTVTINVWGSTSSQVNRGLDNSCNANKAARGDYNSGVSYGRTAKGKPFCN